MNYDEKYPYIILDDVRAGNDFDGRYIDYHMEFFKSGITAVIKKWLNSGCRETPEEMAEIIRTEYRGR